MKKQLKSSHPETRWDDLLKIKTNGRDDSNSDCCNYPYEPTPYTVLERLASSGYITKKNTLADYGCGKGRADFFLSYQTRCRSIGIEYDERIYERAIKNQETAISANRTTFLLKRAEEFPVGTAIDRFYFFNPFSVEILRKVMRRILESWYEHPRDMLLFFYYPSDEYISYLMTVDELTFADEISCEDLFEGKNRRERILIFTVA
ncbi:MAG: SAM-dependent methyltransferase [Eubacteriales bacterium]|nr:SAM-dependent methyltransferase [Eubacteriales bacterium]